MKLVEIINMLKLFPQDAPVLNAPILPFKHGGEPKGIAFKAGNEYYNQNPTKLLNDVLKDFENLLEHGTSLHQMKIDENTDIFLTEALGHAGVKIKGLLFTTEGIRFIGKSFLE